MLQFALLSSPDCGRSAAVENGYVNFTNAVTTFGQSVAVVCDSGYKLMGGSRLECLADGQWSMLVTCETSGSCHFLIL